MFFAWKSELVHAFFAPANLLLRAQFLTQGLIAGIRTLCLAFILLFTVLYVISGFATMTMLGDEATNTWKEPTKTGKTLPVVYIYNAIYIGT